MKVKAYMCVSAIVSPYLLCKQRPEWMAAQTLDDARGCCEIGLALASLKIGVTYILQNDICLQGALDKSPALCGCRRGL